MRGQDVLSLRDPVVVGRKLANHLILLQMAPEYPPLAKVNFIQGQVQMELLVTADGRVGRAHVVYGHPFLAAAALRAVRRWLYRPLVTRNGPTEFLTLVDMNFVLRTKKPEALPSQAEQDLDRQVQPPSVLARPSDPAPASSVRLRVLLSDDGEVMDSHLLKGPPLELHLARRSVAHWSFRPAHWGTLNVPWYLDVDVPIEDAPVARTAAQSGSQ